MWPLLASTPRSSVTTLPSLIWLKGEFPNLIFTLSYWLVKWVVLLFGPDKWDVIEGSQQGQWMGRQVTIGCVEIILFYYNSSYGAMGWLIQVCIQLYFDKFLIQLFRAHIFGNMWICKQACYVVYHLPSNWQNLHFDLELYWPSITFSQLVKWFLFKYEMV